MRLECVLRNEREMVHSEEDPAAANKQANELKDAAYKGSPFHRKNHGIGLSPLTWCLRSLLPLHHPDLTPQADGGDEDVGSRPLF